MKQKAMAKKAIKQRSAWLASMFGCGAFLLLAVKVYHVPVSSLASNLLVALLLMALVLAVAAGLGWVVARLKKRRN